MPTFGEMFKSRRTALGMTLRAFCVENSLDASNLSKIERGRHAPTQRGLVEHYADCLKLAPGSQERQDFLDAAAAQAGRIPEDLLTDAEIVEKLPILFRSLRGQRVPDEKLDELVRKIRGA